MVPVFPRVELFVDMPLVPFVAILLVEDATDCAFEGIALDVPVETDALAPVPCGAFCSTISISSG